MVCRIFEKSGSGPRKPRALYRAPFVEELDEASRDSGSAIKAIPAPDVIADDGPDVVDAVPNVSLDAAQEHDHVGTSDNFEQVLIHFPCSMKHCFLVSANFDYCFLP